MQPEFRSQLARESRRRAWSIASLLVGLSPAVGLGDSSAGAFHLVPPVFPALLEETAHVYRDSPWERANSNGEGTPPPQTIAPPPRPPLFDKWTAAVFLGGSFIATPIAGYLQWWKRSDSEPWHSANERWFQRDTYAGGADKMSHFYYGTIAEEGLIAAYEKLGHPADQARLLAILNTALAAVVIEVGDGFTSYGFSWEDATATTAGAAAFTLVSANKLTDTVGFRFGFLPVNEPATLPPPSPHARSRSDVFGKTPLALQSPTIQPGYTYEIYTVDLKLAGFLPRVHVRPGFARYFLFSATYDARGYNEAPPELRQRNLGLEIGINLAEVCRGIGISESTWWGKPLILFLEHFRVPYTAWGIRYDLNSGQWHGPDFGDKYKAM